MAKVTLLPEILGISGRVGDMVFTTRGDKVFVHKYNRIRRSTPVKPSERHRRSLFARIAREVAQRIANGDQRPRKMIWQEVKQTLS